MGLFLWDHPKEPLEYHTGSSKISTTAGNRRIIKTRGQTFGSSAEKLTRSGSTYFWWGALLLLPGLPFVFFDRKMRVPILIFLLGTAAFLTSIWSFPHYAPR